MQNSSLRNWKRRPGNFNTFTFADGEKDKLDKLIEKFQNYCIPKKNTTMERQQQKDIAKSSNKCIGCLITKTYIFHTLALQTILGIPCRQYPQNPFTVRLDVFCSYTWKAQIHVLVYATLEFLRDFIKT